MAGNKQGRIGKRAEKKPLEPPSKGEQMVNAILGLNKEEFDYVISHLSEVLYPPTL